MKTAKQYRWGNQLLTLREIAACEGVAYNTAFKWIEKGYSEAPLPSNGRRGERVETRPQPKHDAFIDEMLSWDESGGHSGNTD